MTQSHSGRNRRASRRRGPKGSTKISCLRGALGLGRNLAISVLDVSESGASLVLKEPFREGEEMEVNLEGISHRRPIRKPAAAVWCVAAGEDRWIVGVRFQGMLRYTELNDLTRQ